MTRTGCPYLALELRDRTGTVQARAFRDADALAGRFERGDLVRASGRVERFRDDLVLEVLEIERATPESEAVDPAAFLPRAYRDLDELDGFLEHLAEEVHDRQYRALLEALLGDRPLRAVGNDLGIVGREFCQRLRLGNRALQRVVAHIVRDRRRVLFSERAGNGNVTINVRV